MHCASIFPKAVSRDHRDITPLDQFYSPSPPQQYTLHTGSDKISSYSDPTTNSGHPLHRHFCSVCGSKLHALTSLAESIISIPAGLLLSAHSGLGELAKQEGSNAKTVQWKPHKEQYCQEKAGWVDEFGVIDPKERYVLGTMGKRVGEEGKL